MSSVVGKLEGLQRRILELWMTLRLWRGWFLVMTIWRVRMQGRVWGLRRMTVNKRLEVDMRERNL
jgi:hypothetical protein